MDTRIRFLCLCLAWPAFAPAQGVPDAGGLREQIERPLNAPALPGSSAPLAEEAIPQLSLPQGQTVTVSEFRFAGNTLLDDETLMRTVARWTGRPIDFAQLQAAARAVANAYREAGWIVRTLLPRQDVTEGVVVIEVIESRFAGARLEDGSSSRVKPEILLRSANGAQRVGAPVSVAAIDRALLLTGDLPGVVVTGALEPGELPGETALLLNVRGDSLVDGTVTADNGGTRSTGEARVLLNVNLESPLRLGDRARADILGSEGARYGRLGYDLPVGRNGWRIGANASSFDYELISGAFEGLDAHGSSSSFGLDASYPLYRARLKNLYLTAAADERGYRNIANGAIQSKYDITSFTLGVAGNRFDTLLGGGASSASLNLVHGRVGQGAADTGENPVYAGGFWKLRYALTRQQKLTSTLTLHAQLAGQYANEAVDSAERFYLGGPDGTRGYDVNDGGGSRSELVQLEVLWRLHPTTVATVFVDYGHAKNFGEGTDDTLKNAGVELTWTAPHSLRIDATASRNRLWLQASLPF